MALKPKTYVNGQMANPGDKIVINAGPSLTAEQAAMTFASRHANDELRKMLVGFFSTQKGVDSKLKRIDFHTVRYPRVDSIVNQEIEHEIQQWRDSIKSKREEGDNKTAEKFAEHGPFGPGLDASIYNRVDHTVDSKEWYQSGYAIPLQIITSKSKLSDEDAILAMICFLHQVLEEEIYSGDAINLLFPEKHWKELFNLRAYKEFTKDGTLDNERLERLIDRAEKKFCVHFSPLKAAYGPEAYNVAATVIEWSVLDIINYWGSQNGYDKLLCGNGNWYDTPASITKNFRLDWPTVRGLEESAAVCDETQTDIIEALVKEHVSSYVAKRMDQRTFEDHVDPTSLEGDWLRWKATLKTLPGFKINEQKGAPTTKDELDKAMKNVNYHLTSLTKWTSTLTGQEYVPADLPKTAEAVQETRDEPDHFHFAYEAEGNPLMHATVLNTAKYEKPFTPGEKTSTGDADNPFHAHIVTKVDFFNVASYHNHRAEFQQIVGFYIPYPDPGWKFGDLVKEYNHQFEAFIGGKLEDHDCARLTVPLLNGINGTSFAESDFTNTSKTPTRPLLIIPDLRTVKAAEVEEGDDPFDWVTANEEYSPSEDDIDIDEVARQL
jgi:hypothetical protein